MREGMIHTTRAVVCLFAWYIMVFIAGITLLLSKLLSDHLMHSEASVGISLLTSIGAALGSSSLFYTRKLYKDIFAQTDASKEAASGLTEIATFVYYLSRPFFALLFAIIVVVTGVTFIHATTGEGTKLSMGFVFFVILLSAYGAAITGQVVQHIEKLASERIRTFGSPS